MVPMLCIYKKKLIKQTLFPYVYLMFFYQSVTDAAVCEPTLEVATVALCYCAMHDVLAESRNALWK